MIGYLGASNYLLIFKLSRANAKETTSKRICGVKGRAEFRNKPIHDDDHTQLNYNLNQIIIVFSCVAI
jgi:hypothetical protein